MKKSSRSVESVERSVTHSNKEKIFPEETLFFPSSVLIKLRERTSDSSLL